MKFEENWLRGFRGDVIQKCRRIVAGWGETKIALPEPLAQ